MSIKIARISGMFTGIFIGNLIAKKYLGAPWTESLIVATLASIIFVVLISIYYLRKES
jgi:hypothetical protein